MNSSRVGDITLKSLRLQALALFYDGADEVWDIGCDHGHLGLSFLHHPSVRSLYLVDPSASVIENLKATHIPKHSLTLKILHEHGQNLTLSASPKCIFIAGMGGKEIQEISEHLIPQLTENDLLVVSPHRKILELRNFLQQSELGLLEEKVVEENDQFYQVIALRKHEGVPKISLYGEALWKSEVGLRYLEKEKEAFSRHHDQQSRSYVLALEAISAGSMTK